MAGLRGRLQGAVDRLADTPKEKGADTIARLRDERAEDFRKRNLSSRTFIIGGYPGQTTHDKEALPSQPLTMAQMSMWVYGSPDYADVLLEHNVLKVTGKTLSGVPTYNEGTLYAPARPQNLAIVLRAETTTSKYDIEGRVVVVQPPIKSDNPQTEADVKVLDAAPTEGLNLYICPHWQDASGFERIEDLTGIAIRSSIFEGVRTVELTMPYEYPRDKLLHFFANRVVIGLGRELLFAGILVAPKVNSKKGRTISWVAQSHSYVATKTHFNPYALGVRWEDFTPYQIVNEVSRLRNVPVAMTLEAQDRLAEQYLDQDKLSEWAEDILSTTPYKLLERVAASANMFLYPDEKGYFIFEESELRDVGGAGVKAYLADGENCSMTSTYNFDTLAETFNVASQRRDSDGFATAKIEEGGFPLPIIRNVVREHATGGLGEAAIFEAKKDFSIAVQVSAEVQGWTRRNANGAAKPWRLKDLVSCSGDLIFADSLEHSYIVTGVKFVQTGKKQVTILKLSPPLATAQEVRSSGRDELSAVDTGSFEPIPFLTVGRRTEEYGREGGEGSTFVTQRTAKVKISLIEKDEVEE